jgi:hypothetical protein
MLPPHFQHLHPVFSVNRLSLVLPDPIPGCQYDPPPPPTIVDGRQEYKVKEILDSCMRYNYLEYLIKGKGYDVSHNSWEVHQQVYTKSKIITFHHNHPGAAQHINAATFDCIPVRGHL